MQNGKMIAEVESLREQENIGSSPQVKELALDRKGTHQPLSWEVSQREGVQVQMSCYDPSLGR